MVPRVLCGFFFSLKLRRSFTEGGIWLFFFCRKGMLFTEVKLFAENSVPSTPSTKEMQTEVRSVFTSVYVCTHVGISVEGASLKVNTCERGEWPECGLNKWLRCNRTRESFSSFTRDDCSSQCREFAFQGVLPLK